MDNNAEAVEFKYGSGDELGCQMSGLGSLRVLKKNLGSIEV